MSFNNLKLGLLLELISNHYSKDCPCQHCRCDCHHYKLSHSSNIEGHNKRLNYDEDRTLYIYIDHADNIDLSIRKKTFVVTANSIL